MKSQVKHKDGKECKRPGNADGKKKVWMPQGVGAPACALDDYKKVA